MSKYDDEKVRAALALDLLEKMDAAIVMVGCHTAEDVRTLMRGMIEAARDVATR